MFNESFQDINFDDPIKEQLPNLIELFVKFYGEKYREKITNNFNHTFFVYVKKPEHDDLNKLQILISQKKEERIYQYFNDKNLDSFSFEEFEKLDFPKWIKDIEEGKDLPPLLSKFIQDYLGFNQSNTYVMFDSKETKKMALKVMQSHLKDYNQCLSDIENLNSEYEKIVSSIKKATEYRENLLSLYNEKSNKILQELLQKRLKIENFDEFKPFLTVLRSIFIKEQAFRTVEEKEGLEKIWKICKDKDGNLKREEFDKIISDPIAKEELSKLHSNYVEKLLESYPSVKKVMNEIKNNGLFEGTILSSIENYICSPGSDVVAFVEPTYYNSDPNTLYSFCVLPTIFNLCDSTLFHELNHIAVSDILSNNETNLIVKTGILVSSFDKDLNVSIGMMKDSLVNEVINDYFALKICREFERNGGNIGLTSNVPSTYSRAFPLLKEFIEDNFNELKECLMNKDKDIAKKIGLDNFDIIANATRNILINRDSNQLFDELTSRYGLSDINEIIDLDNLQLSEVENNYLNNYRQTNYVTNKLKLEKMLPKHEERKVTPKSITHTRSTPKKEKYSSDTFDFSNEIK